jgi:S-adenosylmethionine-diacylgycerolhomoserine-N-methlytransferase
MKYATNAANNSSAATAMDRMYRWQHAIYDVTRKPYLLGRDRMLETLRPTEGANVLEIGCGTGRNLIVAARRWPNSRFFGYDVSAVMIGHAKKAVTRAGLDHQIVLLQGDACDLDPHIAFGESRFERIYISYVLSMIPAWRDVLASAAHLIKPGGALHVADFGDQSGMDTASRRILNTWLGLFDVTPRLDLEQELTQIALARQLQASCEQIYRGYAVVARLSRPLA